MNHCSRRRRRQPESQASVSTPEETVFIVDDDPSVRRGLTRLMRSAGLDARAFASAGEFLDAVAAPDTCGCAVIDLHMPGLNGLDLQRRMTQGGLRIPSVFISGNGDIPSTVAAMQHGALTFLTKPVHDEELLAAVRKGLERCRRYLAAAACVQEIRGRIAGLTEREQEVMAYVITGTLNKQIATELGIVEKTVKVHRHHVFAKMKVESVADLVRLCDAAGFKGARPAA
jgi:FixJ family two-component response regulator